MTPEQADKIIEKESERARTIHDACDTWCRKEVASFVSPMPKWSEIEKEPDLESNPADQYRHWLWELDMEDSVGNRATFEGVLSGWQIKLWNGGVCVEWWYGDKEDD